MNIPTVIGQKIEQTQAFLENGTRVPLTHVYVGENSVSQIKTVEKDGYSAVQVAFGERNKIAKPLAGHLKKAGLKKSPRFLREIRVGEVEGIGIGAAILPEEVLKPGDKIDVVGISKGKGFAGGVKRWGFRGGPKTHGQSDRHRAPGSIGQGTTPGRVYKGKKMAGRMGNEQVTIKNLEVIDIKDGEVIIKGLVPGPKGGVIVITKIGENKNFKPLFTVVEETVEVSSEEVAEVPIETSIETNQAAKASVETEKAVAADTKEVMPDNAEGIKEEK